jgi:hypothetical protein
MTTATTTLADFLLREIAADEAAARAANERQQITWATTADTAASVAGADAGLFILFNNPAHVLALCSALRAIVERITDGCTHAPRVGGWCLDCDATLRNLAAAFADRPGFQEEWR